LPFLLFLLFVPFLPTVRQRQISAPDLPAVPSHGLIDVRYFDEGIMKHENEQQQQKKQQLESRTSERRSPELKLPLSQEEVRRQLGWGLVLLGQKINARR
jgi:hypothetical protein